MEFTICVGLFVCEYSAKLPYLANAAHGADCSSQLITLKFVKFYNENRCELIMASITKVKLKRTYVITVFTSSYI